MCTAPRGLQVRDTSGNEMLLDDVWSGGPALLCFVRHFGCIFCRQQVSGFCRQLRELESGGASLVFVGSGTPLMAQAFQEEHCPGSRVFVDTELEAFRAFGLRRGMWTNVDIRTALKAFRAYRAGHRQVEVQGDPWQQGGVFVIDATGRIRYSYVSRYAGDHPDPVPVVDVLRRPG
jgi:peroxiredoxin